MKIQELSSTIKDCRFCWMCRNICPVSKETALETNTPRGKALTLWTVLTDMRDIKEEDIVKTVYECCLCEACKDACVTDRDMPQVVLAAREDIVNEGVAPQKIQDLGESIITVDNPWNLPKEKRTESLEELIADLPAHAEVLLYLGCNTSYKQPQLAQAAIRLFKAIGVDFTVLKDEPCCGIPLFRSGYRDEAQKKAIDNLEVIKKTKCHSIVTLCASCFSAFQEEYPKLSAGFDSDLRILHSSKFIAELMNKGTFKPKKAVHKKITFHDPCVLARKHQQWEEPRYILSQIPGLTLTEMRSNRQNTRCCGSTLTHLLFPDLGQKIASARIAEAQETKAETIVTTCPSCKLFLGEQSQLEVLDLLEILEDTI